MKLVRLDIAGFGRLADLHIEFSHGLTLIAGPNEAGKSTMVECILRLLYGYPEHQYNDERKRYQPWTPGVPYAASLTYRLDNGEAYEIARDFERSDVPTDVFDAATRRRLVNGDRKRAPGEDALKISLDVYRAAAVIKAGDFQQDPKKGDALQVLADRVASIVGSAGDESAAAAIARLKEAHAAIGQRGVNTQLGESVRRCEQADEALSRFRAEFDNFQETLRRRGQLEETIKELQTRRRRYASALAAARARSTREKRHRVAVLQRVLADAESARTRVQAAPRSAASRDEFDAAVEQWRTAERVAADATARTSSPSADVAAAQTALDAAGNELMERRAALARAEDLLKRHKDIAASHPPLSDETLAQLDREADAVGALDSKERQLSAQAGFARQRRGPSPAAPLLAMPSAIVVLAAGIFWHSAVADIVAVLLFLLGVVLGAAAFRGLTSRRNAIHALESAAAQARSNRERAEAALAARCRALGCADVPTVREARTAQRELAAVQVQRDAAADAAEAIARQRDTLQQRLEDLRVLRQESVGAQSAVQESRALLGSVLQQLGVASAQPSSQAEIEESVLAARRMLDAGEEAARATAAIEKARADLHEALAGATPASLDEDLARYEAEAAQRDDNGELAAQPEEELDRELGIIDAHIHDADRDLAIAQGSIAEFERTHPMKMADLEEEAAAAGAARKRFELARLAAKTAWEQIELVKDVVHRDFTPSLNAVVEKATGVITAGRYDRAWVDQQDFTVRIQAPESGATLEGPRLSTGTVEQLQFALRAAIAKALSGAESVPLLCDDALAHADDDRLNRALSYAAAIGRDGTQIVFFTQRTDIASTVAQDDCTKVVFLDGPSR